MMEIDEQVMAAKFDALLPHLDERGRRLVLGAEARWLGHGGIELVARASGISRKTVAAGAAELESGTDPLEGRIRREGGGRKPLAETSPDLAGALDDLVEPETRGDPMTRLRWTTRSTRNLAGELRGQGYRVSHHSVARLLKDELGYSLQGNAKTIEGKQHPDRDGQFRYISGQVTAHLAAGEPVISAGLPSFSTIVGVIEDSGRLFGPGRFASKPTRPYAFGAPGLAVKSSSSLFNSTPVPSATRPRP